MQREEVSERRPLPDAEHADRIWERAENMASNTQTENEKKMSEGSRK